MEKPGFFKSIKEYFKRKKATKCFKIKKGVLVRYLEYRSNTNDIVIPEGVTEIGDEAFWGCKSLKNITIPEGVTEIGERAFWDCESLKNITIPEGVTEIGDEAFWNCESLKNITIPEGVTKNV